MKILKISSMAKNILIYILIQPLFLHIQLSNKIGHGIFPLERIWQIIMDYKLIFLLGIFVMILVLKVHKYSSFFLGGYLVAIAVLGFIPFVSEFDKLILFGSFFNIVFSFYLWMLWKLELEEACYHPSFNKNQMIRLHEYDLELALSRGDSIYYGHLTNWSSDSAFFSLDAPLTLKGKYDLEINFKGHIFKSVGSIVTRYGTGYGIKFHDDRLKDDGYSSWYDFYTVIDDRGYVARMV